jgi:hypothetical protein
MGAQSRHRHLHPRSGQQDRLPRQACPFPLTEATGNARRKPTGGGAA